MFYNMSSTKRKKILRGKKSQSICQYCGGMCSNNCVIHKKCAISYLESQGYVIMDFNLQRVFFGEDRE